MMRALLVALVLLCGAAAPAKAQGCGPSNPNCVVPTAANTDSSNRAASTAFVKNVFGSNIVTCSAHQWVNTIGLAASLCSQPAFSDISGTVPAVTSITCGAGLSGGTVTTTGTCAVNLTTANNILGADVALNNTANYFDGPSMAQGGTGTWFASGTVTVLDSVNATFACKLWDGTTVISSAAVNATSTFLNAVSLSGYLASPAGNIRISCKNIGDTTGAIKFNASGNSKDSSIFGFRVQ